MADAAPQEPCSAHARILVGDDGISVADLGLIWVEGAPINHSGVRAVYRHPKLPGVRITAWTNAEAAPELWSAWFDGREALHNASFDQFARYLRERVSGSAS